MERLCKLNTATLSTRTHLASKPTQITLNHVYRSFKVTHFEITEMPTRVCVLLYNNMGFRVGNFKGKVSTWSSISVFENPIHSAPLSRNPANNHTNISRNYKTYILPMIGLSWFNFSVDSVKRFFSEKVRFGRSRLSKVKLILIPIESAWNYFRSIPT